MALGRWSINSRLVVIQLVVAFVVIYLRVVLYDLRQHQTLLVSVDSEIVGRSQQPETRSDSNNVQNRPKPIRRPSDEVEVKVQTVPAANEPLHQPNNLSRCPTLRRPKKYDMASSGTLTSQLSGTWTLLKDGVDSTVVHVYSTYYDSRRRRSIDDVPSEHLQKNEGGSGRQWLRLLVIASGLNVEAADHETHKTAVFCHVWYNGTEFPSVVEARITRLENDDVIDSNDFRSYVVACPLMHEANPLRQPIPHYVSMSIGSECGGDVGQSGSESDDAVLFPVEPLASAVLSREELPKSTDAAEVELVLMCVAPVEKKMLNDWTTMYDERQEIRAPWLVEWMELLKLFGVSQVTMYTAFNDLTDADASTRQLIDFYTSRTVPLNGRLVIRPLPDPVPNTGADHSESRLAAIAYNDCLLRYGSRFRFVTSLSSADELIVPRRKLGNYSAVFKQMESIRRNPFSATALSFRGATFSIDIKRAVLADSFLTTVRHRLRSKIEPLAGNHVIDPLRCAEISSSGACISELTFDLAESGQPKAIEAPLGVGVLHRYRACQPEVEDSNKMSCAVEKDNALMRFQQQLKLNIVQTLKDSGLIADQEQLHQVAIRL